MRTTAKKKNLFLRIALLALAIYALVSLIQLRLQLNEGQRTLDTYKTLSANQLTVNAELQDQIDNRDVYLEQEARKQGLAKPGETILVEIPKD